MTGAASMRAIRPLASAVLAVVLIYALAQLVANDALGRQRCLALSGQWNPGFFGGHCGTGR